MSCFVCNCACNCPLNWTALTVAKAEEILLQPLLFLNQHALQAVITKHHFRNTTACILLVVYKGTIWRG